MADHVGIAVTPRRYDPSGIAGQIARNYGAAFERLGLTPIYVDLATADEAAFGRLRQPDVKLLFSHGGWLFNDQGPLGSRGPALAREADKPTIVLIADPPFSWWLPPIFAALPRRAMPFFIDPSFAEGIGHWIPSGAHASYVPCGHTLDGHGPVPTADKDIPALFIGSLQDPNKLYEELKQRPDLLHLIRPIIDAVIDDPFKPLLHAANEPLAESGRTLNFDKPLARSVLHKIDQFVREHRRARMVNRLLHHDVHIVAHGVARLPAGARATLLPPVHFLGMLNLLRRAKAICVCQPHFPGALNERIVFAMQARCLVIATPNTRTPQLFEHGRHLFLTAPDLSDVDRWVEAARDDSVADPMREAALRQVTERHTPEGNIRHMLRRLGQAGLMDPGVTVPDGPELTMPPLDAGAKLGAPTDSALHAEAGRSVDDGAGCGPAPDAGRA